MSNIGLSANTFRITSKYLDLLNDFIVKANLHPAVMEAKKDQVIDFLSKVNDTGSLDPQFQLLSSIIDRQLRNLSPDKTINFIDHLITEIKDNQINMAMPKIELIVEALDSENSKALAKIKGE